jgi:RNA polymerase sigma factor (sigma-70 family)
MQVILHYENDRQCADDCFLFVCEKLSDDGFRRLLQFDANRNTQFNTWLGLVVSNLCVDWRRREYGRQRPYQAISQLSNFDQLLYHYEFECGMNRQGCFRALQQTYPDVTEDQLAVSLGRLHTALKPRQRWQLSIRRHESGSASFVNAEGDVPKNSEPVEKGPGPESMANLQQTREAISGAMSRLSKQQRLLLRLRYQEDLPLKDVAALAGLGDMHQAKRQIKSALESLAEMLDDDLLAS